MNNKVLFPFRFFIITFIWSWMLWTPLVLGSLKIIPFSAKLLSFLTLPVIMLGVFENIFEEPVTSKIMTHMNLRMETLVRSIVFTVVFSFPAGNGLAQSITTESLYMGQTPPGNIPKIFPLSVKQGFFAAERIAISDDGTEIYYSEIKGYYPIKGENIKRYSYSDGKWTGPFYLFKGYAPALSVSGDTIFLERDNSDQKYETYISVRIGSGWTSPKRILTRIETTHYLQPTRSGNYYVSSVPGNGAGLNDWCILKITGSDTTVLSLGKPLNTDRENLDFFVSRDESFMIVTNRPGLAISFRNSDGSWTIPINFGPKINFGLGSWGPWLTPDNKYLFYTTGTKPDYSDVAVYWVRIDYMIDSLRIQSQAIQ